MKKIGAHNALGPGTGCPPCEAWRLGWMVSELWLTSAYNIMSRTTWLSGARPGADPANASALREWERMWSEKLLAGMELGLEMQRAGLGLMLGQANPWRVGVRLLHPLHKRTVANSRRLSRRDRTGT